MALLPPKQIDPTKEKINRLLFIVDLKVFVKNAKELKIQLALVKICSQDVYISFSVDKDAKITINKCHLFHTEGIVAAPDNTTQDLQE